MNQPPLFFEMIVFCTAAAHTQATRVLEWEERRQSRASWTTQEQCATAGVTCHITRDKCCDARRHSRSALAFYASWCEKLHQREQQRHRPSSCVRRVIARSSSGERKRERDVLRYRRSQRVVRTTGRDSSCECVRETSETCIVVRTYARGGMTF